MSNHANLKQGNGSLRRLREPLCHRFRFSRVIKHPEFEWVVADLPAVQADVTSLKFLTGELVRTVNQLTNL